MSSTFAPGSWPLFAAGLLMIAACSDTPSAVSDLEIDQSLEASAEARSPHQRLPADIREWVHDLRRATSPFRNFDEAAAAGYVAALSPCVESPAGGMGYHYGNPALIDGQLEALRPEILLYEPRSNGRLRFVGVEFIVPFAAWTSAEPPQVRGIPLHANAELGLWALHVWTERHNPSGVFEDFNPMVSCSAAN